MSNEERRAEAQRQREYEDTVMFSAWLQGFHREDVKVFDPGDFVRGELFKAIRDGKSLYEIGNNRINGYDLASLSSLLGSFNEVFYNSVFQKRAAEKAAELVKMMDPKSADLAAFQKRINAICGAALNRPAQLSRAKDLATGFLDELGARRHEKRQRWGIPSLDWLTGGIRRKELTALSARPGDGKSAFALRLADRLQRWGEKVLFFPLEMSTNETLGRLCIMNDLITEKDLKSGTITGEQEEQIKTFLEDLERRGTLEIFEGVRDLEVIDGLTEDRKPFIIIIDQLTQLNTRDHAFDSIVYKYTYLTAKLKELAMTRNVAVLLLCQLGRNGKQDPSMVNLKWSGSIEEDCDNVIIMQRIPAGEYKGNIPLRSGQQVISLNLTKQRSGNLGQFEMIFFPSRLDFKQPANY